jgi:hypothetical protein
MALPHARNARAWKMTIRGNPPNLLEARRLMIVAAGREE